MTYGTNAYASARVAELHRAGAERRAAGAAHKSRLALVVALMRVRDHDRSGRSARLAVASAPGAAPR